MKRFLPILAGAAALFAAAPAHADAVPKVQLGTWCVSDDDRGSFIEDEKDRVNCVEGEKPGRILQIKRDRFDWISEGEVCSFVSVKHTKSWWANSTKAKYPEEWNPVTRIKMMCGGSSRHQYEIVYNKGTLRLAEMLSWD
jgi:hypothetical protein